MATIYDIAKASGVSATTVSHVLNRTRYVSPEITERVMAAVDRKSTRLNSSHPLSSRMPSSA